MTSFCDAEKDFSSSSFFQEETGSGSRHGSETALLPPDILDKFA
jgi:hypothetical protein